MRKKPVKKVNATALLDPGYGIDKSEFMGLS
jgi:hypothetical protein